MEFVKVEDIEKKLKEINESLGSMTGDDVYESLVNWLESAKKYHTEHKPYMPIKIRDYGYTDGPHEYDCGADLNHHWLQINADDGNLFFINMQTSDCTFSEEGAKKFGASCFVPNYESKDGKKYITPETMLVLVEGEDGEDF